MQRQRKRGILTPQGTAIAIDFRTAMLDRLLRPQLPRQPHSVTIPYRLLSLLRHLLGIAGAFASQDPALLHRKKSASLKGAQVIACLQPAPDTQVDDSHDCGVG